MPVGMLSSQTVSLDLRRGCLGVVSTQLVYKAVMRSCECIDRREQI